MAETSPRHDTVNNEDDDSNPKIDIHPSFTEGDVVLQPAEGLCFRYQLSSLAKHSSFFDDLSELPLPEGEENNIIPFPDTSEATLRFTLELIDYRQLPDLTRPVLERCESLSDILDFWDTFDLTSLLPALYEWSKEAYAAKPEVHYALSWHCLGVEGPSNIDRNEGLRRRYWVRIREFEPWALESLKRNRPDDYSSICRDVERSRSRREDLETMLLDSQEHPITFRFGQRCRWGRCSNYLTHGLDYGAFQRRVLPGIILERLLTDTHFGDRRYREFHFKQVGMSDLDLRGVVCTICRNRITTRVRHVVAKFTRM